MAATSEALVDAVLWVAEHLDDEEDAEIPRGLRRTMWNMAQADRTKFLDRYLTQALVYRQKAEATGVGKVRELEEADVARLERKLGRLMNGRQRVFCEKCWRELGDALGPVEVVHHRGTPQ